LRGFGHGVVPVAARGRVPAELVASMGEVVVEAAALEVAACPDDGATPLCAQAYAGVIPKNRSAVIKRYCALLMRRAFILGSFADQLVILLFLPEPVHTARS